MRAIWLCVLGAIVRDPRDSRTAVERFRPSQGVESAIHSTSARNRHRWRHGMWLYLPATLELCDDG